jgi:hypothetical protein
MLRQQNVIFMKTLKQNVVLAALHNPEANS